jgi:2-polyprenyl-3-methyl-5-hydroxy-6-metoxy-1,4-benzoquinol methylase
MDGFDVNLQRTKVIYRTFRRISDNAHGNTTGISGSLTPDSLKTVLRAADVFGSRFLDIGAADGKAMAAALASGAFSVHGFELRRTMPTHSSSMPQRGRLRSPCFTIRSFCLELDWNSRI